MGDEAVKVIVRCRPMNEREDKLNCETVVNMETRIAQVQLRKPKSADRIVPPKAFTFDGSYFTKDTTKQIYDEICFPLVQGVLQGFNGTVFAYGQTGCGKSYTMMGVSDPPEQTGVIPRAFDHIFDHIAVTGDTKFLVHASYLEIYNEEVRDLLGKDVKKKLELKEHPERGVYVQGLSTHKVHNPKDLERVMSIGSKNRSVGATLMNVDSSRSHSIFTISLEMIGDGPDGEESLKTGKLNLVDLAGSERQSKTGSTGERLKEATKINLSLSALGNVISALVDGKSTHIPYRDSKLTRLLQSSLGGNTKTLMIACVSPADNNYDETLSTLRYANRAKNIKNKPRVNEDPKDALLREYQEEIKKLKMMLLGQTEVPGSLGGAGGQLGRDIDTELAAMREEYERQIAELKAQFGDEHSSKTQLAEELRKLQESYDRELAAAKEQHHTQATGAMTNGVMAGAGGVGTNDREILAEHERAIQRLESLQIDMIGGEKTDDQQLREKMAARHKIADERLAALRQANGGLDDDDDGILERIFNSLTEEVRAKTRALERMHDRLKSAEDDISDIQGEFQDERQEYLDTIRRQEQTILLQQQILDTMVPLIRRECNYHNLDKVLSECKYDEDSGKWILPKVSTASTSLSPVTSKSLVTSSSSSSTSHSPHHVKPKRHTLADNGRAVTEDHLSQRLQRADEQNYFKQKRAQELLAECSMMKEMSSTPPTTHRQMKGAVSLNTMQHSSLSMSHDPPLAHGVEGRFLPANDSLARPRKLESLIHLPLPGSAAGSPLLPLPENQTMVNKADKMIAAQRKRGPEGPRKPYL